MSAHQPTLLVTGASGQMGQRVIDLLLEAQAGPIIATTRTPDKLAHLADRGVTVRRADFDDYASLVEAFKGADRLLLISTDAVGVPGQRLSQHQNAIKAAQEAGVRHVVYTSLANISEDSPIAIAPDHYGTEQALAGSKLGWTVLRNNIYAETLLGALKYAIQSGKLINAAGEGKTAYMTRDDFARAAAAALAAPFEGRRTLEITGAQALSQADLAAIASEISGQQVEYVPVDLETVIQNLEAVGLPRFLAETYATFDLGISQGKLGKVTRDYEALTGRQPTPIRDFLVEHREFLLEGQTA